MKFFSNHTLKLIILCSTLYGILVQSGFYGYNIDYYREYYKKNLYYDLIFDRFGAYLSTLTISNYSIGLFLTSFFLALASGLFLFKCFKFYLSKKNVLKKKYIFLFFLIIYIITLHIHPIIMSTSGAMRQGWSMVFLFFSMILILDKKFILSVIFITFSIFMHKSGVINFIYFICMFFSLLIVKKFKQKMSLMILFSTIFSLIFFYLFIYLKENSFLIGTGLVAVSQSTRVVYGDFRIFWLFINIIYIILFIIYGNKSKLHDTLKYPATFLFFASVGNIIVLSHGLNFQYERLNMMIGIIYLHVVALMFRKYYIYLIFVLSLIYLFFTINQGMYSIGLI